MAKEISKTFTLNQAIIFINKDLFGKTKEVIRFPLEDICLSGGKPQVALGPDSHVSRMRWLSAHIAVPVINCELTFVSGEL